VRGQFDFAEATGADGPVQLVAATAQRRVPRHDTRVADVQPTNNVLTIQTQRQTYAFRVKSNTTTPTTIKNKTTYGNTAVRQAKMTRGQYLTTLFRLVNTLIKRRLTYDDVIVYVSYGML